MLKLKMYAAAFIAFTFGENDVSLLVIVTYLEVFDSYCVYSLSKA